MLYFKSNVHSPKEEINFLILFTYSCLKVFANVTGIRSYEIFVASNYSMLSLVENGHRTRKKYVLKHSTSLRSYGEDVVNR